MLKSWRNPRLLLLAVMALTFLTAPAVAQAAATLSAAPVTVQAGQPATATWSGLAAPSVWDWVGVFTPGASASNRVTWVYANTCTQTIGSTSRAAGSCSVTIPASTTPGAYELRYYTYSAGLIATSGPITVTTPTCLGSTPNIHEYVDGCPLYNAGSWVNAPLPTSAPVDPNSASMAQVQMKTMGLNPDGTLASGSQQGQRWWEAFDVYVQNSTDRSTWKTVCSTEVLSGSSWSWMDQLHNAWVTFKAPIPAGGLPALDGGGDQGATVYNAPTGEMWDFFQWKGAAPAGTTDPQGHPCDYEAAGGDYQNDLANHPGYFVNQSLGSGVTESSLWGRRAAAMPSMAGVITPDEWNNPLPDLGHTLQIIVGCADTQKQYWPATRHDGCTAGNGGLPEGARVRISPSYVCPHGTAGSTGPTQLAYDRAYSFCATLQKYGAVVTDQTGGGTTFTIASVRGGKSSALTPDGGNCCAANTPVGTGTQWPNWYWDVDVNKALPGLQVIDQSYRPPYAPAQ